jgi:hypothetical protein
MDATPIVNTPIDPTLTNAHYIPGHASLPPGSDAVIYGTVRYVNTHQCLSYYALQASFVSREINAAEHRGEPINAQFAVQLREEFDQILVICLSRGYLAISPAGPVNDATILSPHGREHYMKWVEHAEPFPDSAKPPAELQIPKAVAPVADLGRLRRSRGRRVVARVVTNVRVLVASSESEDTADTDTDEDTVLGDDDSGHMYAPRKSHRRGCTLF